MQLSVGAPPAGQNAGGRIEEGLEVGGAFKSLRRLRQRVGIAVAADRIGRRGHLAQARYARALL